MDRRRRLAGLTRQICCTQELCHGLLVGRLPDSPCTTLGRPLVSPGFAGRQVPAGPRWRTGESGGAAADCAGAISSPVGLICKQQ
jgi:hypothetical protein